jgi:uncharacterized protein (UPF0297 family)
MDDKIIIPARSQACADGKSQRELFRMVYDALRENGYNPISQLVGYLISEDPTYITDCNNARALIQHVDREVIMAEMVKEYLSVND